jgi:hypothetical protein
VSLFRSEIARDLPTQERVRGWIAALRSGRYQQTREALRTEQGFCCLGVACDVHDPRGWHEQDGNWSHRGVFGELARQLADDYLLETADGRYGPRLEGDTLTADNDQGMTFAEIADVIEAELDLALAKAGRRERR